MTENEILRDLFEKGESITRKEFIDRYGFVNLPARISELKDAGMEIVKVMEYGTNRWGAPTHWARYSLKRAGNETA